MADRKRKAAAAAKHDAESSVRLVSQRDLRALMDQCIGFEDRASTASGSMGELIREYADKKNLHRGAFAIAKKLCRMGRKDPGKLWLLLAHLDDYREKLKIDRMAKEQGQLLPAGAEIVQLGRDVDEEAGEAAE